MELNLDKEGFLRNHRDWSPEIAAQLAANEDLELSPEHWEVMHLVRDYYENHRLFPANRVLIAKMRESLGEDKGSSIHLMQLFTGKPAKILAKVAGLPKPPNCD